MAKKTSALEPGKYKVCRKCRHKNPMTATNCEGCSSTSFAPSFILDEVKLGSAASVAVTQSNPEFGEVKQRITLSKWFPPAFPQKFHIRTQEEWEKISNIVNQDLGPTLGWAPYPQQVKAATETATKGGSAADSAITDLLKVRPTALSDIATALTSGELSPNDIDDAFRLLNDSTKILANSSTQFKQQFLKIVQEISKASKTKDGLDQLDGLLASWSLQQIAAVAQQVRQRLDQIDLFRKLIHDEKTYEITGDNSIHRNLERSMWLINEDYWLAHSNQSLRTFIGDEMSKKDKKKFGKKRPDFVCCTTGSRLILIELKRPSHTLTEEDLNQLETYYVLSKKYATQYTSFESYLVGNKADEDVRERVKLRSGVRIYTYSDLLNQAEKRYEDYLKAVEKAK